MRRHPVLLSSPMLAAAFLMATSAIGPGFLTQTAVFTDRLKASFGFAVLVSVVLDIVAQLNIWRIVTMSGTGARALANRVIPGAGQLLTLLIVLGGLAFNIGNLAGAGMGLQVLTGLDVRIGAALSALVAVLVFSFGRPLAGMDAFARVLGVLMLVLTLWVVFTASPPFGEALHRSLLPTSIDTDAIITLVGGTVGGYISFAGAHRLLESGHSGPEHLAAVNRSAVSGILLASAMRILLFLAALAVVSKGVSLGGDNPAAAVFRSAAGVWGEAVFGVVMWSAALTSVVGSAFTSVAFLKGMRIPLLPDTRARIIAFISLSAGAFLLLGRPVRLLLFAGAVNGLILPFSLALMLYASTRKGIMGRYRHPSWLLLSGLLVAALTLWMALVSLSAYVRG